MLGQHCVNLVTPWEDWNVGPPLQGRSFVASPILGDFLGGLGAHGTVWRSNPGHFLSEDMIFFLTDSRHWRQVEWGSKIAGTLADMVKICENSEGEKEWIT